MGKTINRHYAPRAKMGRPRKDGRDALQVIFDAQYTRVFNRLRVSRASVRGWAGDNRPSQLRKRRRRLLSIALTEPATEFIYRK